jgi:aryl-alcohol dehydrogenase-like predicted oxidoreductase
MKYKLLGNSGLRVSEICLGTMTFGTEWGTGADYQESKNQFFYFLEQGGNFIDTANRYTEGTSEQWLGEFVKESKRRDELVIATKYSLFTEPNKINDGGNHRKNLVQSLEKSLKRLQMEYVDILYLHAWDFSVPVEEVMRSLEYCVQSGKVLHIAFSDTPAWIIAQAQTIAEFRGWSKLCCVQLEYSLITRDIEREYFRMCEQMNLPILAWAPLAGGALTGKYLTPNSDEPKRLKPESKRLNARSTKIAEKVVEIAQELGTSPTQVALRWVMNKKNIIPIIGARTTQQLKDSLNVVNFELPENYIKELNEISSIEMGFPHEFLVSDNVINLLWNGLQNKM